MNTEEYISSGILELYATGALSAAEKAEVELWAQKYPEIQAELNLIIDTLDQYAQMHAVTPPAHLRDKILGAINQTGNPAPENKNENFLPKSAADTHTSDNVIPINRANPESEASLFNWLVAAALALLFISTALNFYFYKNWQTSAQNLSLAMASQQQYAQNVQQVKQQLNENQQTLALLTNQETVKVPLKGVKNTPDAQVVVYWHRPSQRIIVDCNQLPKAPAGKQYQLWALADGKPIDAGLIKNSPDVSSQLQAMKGVAVAQAFAITLEPQGGSVNPTIDQMVVMGQI